MKNWEFWMIVFSASCQLLSACHSADETTLTAADKKYLTRKKIELAPVSKSEKERSYTYRTISETIMEEKVRDNEIRLQSKTDLTSILQVQKDSAASYLFKIRYENFDVMVDAGQMKKSFSAKTASQSTDPQERVFSAFKNAVLTAKVSPNGSLLSVTGLDKIQADMYQMAGKDPNALEMIKNSLLNFASEANWKQSLEGITKIFPDKIVKVGDQWNVQSNTVSDLGIEVPLTYSFTAVRNGIAIIQLEGKVDIEKKQVPMQGSQVLMSINGKQVGTIQVNLETGMVTQSTSTFTAKGTIATLGQEIPLTITMKNQTTGTPR